MSDFVQDIEHNLLWILLQRGRIDPYCTLVSLARIDRKIWGASSLTDDQLIDKRRKVDTGSPSGSQRQNVERVLGVEGCLCKIVVVARPDVLGHSRLLGGRLL